MAKLKGWLKKNEKGPTGCPSSGKLINHGETLRHITVTSLRGSFWRKLNFQRMIAVSSTKQKFAFSIFTCQYSSKNSVKHLTELKILATRLVKGTYNALKTI